MADTLKHVVVDAQTDIDQLLTEADNRPLILVKNGARYRLSRYGAGMRDPWAAYDPVKAKENVARLAGAWADLDTDAMIEMLYRARALGSKPPIQP